MTGGTNLPINQNIILEEKPESIDKKIDILSVHSKSYHENSLLNENIGIGMSPIKNLNEHFTNSPVRSLKALNSVKSNNTIESSTNLIKMKIYMEDNSPSKKNLKEEFFKSRNREDDVVLFTVKGRTSDEIVTQY